MALIDNINLYKKLVIEVDEPITDIITCVQEDADSRYLDVQLFKSGVSFDLSGTKVRIYMVKPDGTNIMNDGEITDAVSGRCQFLLTTQALAACGILKTQIKVFSETEEQILSTQIFKIDVTESLLTNKTIESTNEYGSLVILFQDIYEALQVMTAIKNNFGEPGETAKLIPVETFWQMLEAVYNVNAEALKNVSMSEVIKKLSKIEIYSGRVRAYDGRMFAAIMEGVATKLPTVQKGSESFDGAYRGCTYDNDNFYVSTLYSIYKISKSTLEVLDKVSYSGAEVFGCDDEYVYAAKNRYIVKFDKSTLSQVAMSSSSIEHEGGYDGSVLDGNYIYTTRSSGIYYSKVDKKSLNVLSTNSGLGDMGDRLMANCGSYIVVSPAGLYRLSKSDLNSIELVSSSAVSPKVLLCDSQYAYVLGSTKYQKFNVPTKEKMAEVNSSVTLGQYYNFDCQNDDFLFLVPSSGGKAKKISKATLEVIVETEEDVSKVFFADNTYMYCAMSDGKPGKIQVAPESGNFSIVGFKEV